MHVAIGTHCLLSHGGARTAPAHAPAGCASLALVAGLADRACMYACMHTCGRPPAWLTFSRARGCHVCVCGAAAQMDALMADKSDDDLEVWVAEVIYTASSKNVVGFGDGLGEALSTIHLTPEQLAKLKKCFHALDNDESG